MVLVFPPGYTERLLSIVKGGLIALAKSELGAELSFTDLGVQLSGSGKAETLLLDEDQNQIMLCLEGITVATFDEKSAAFLTVFKAALNIRRDRLLIFDSTPGCVKVIVQMPVMAVVGLLLFIGQKDSHKAFAASLKYLFPSLETIDIAIGCLPSWRLDVESIAMQELESFSKLKSGDFSSGAVAMIEAVRAENNVLLEALLTVGVLPDSKCAGKFYNWADECSSAALHHACFLNNVEAVNTLIDFKADVNIQNNRGETPLLFGAFKGNLTLVQSLIGAGAVVLHRVDCSQQVEVDLPQYSDVYFVVNGCNAFHMACLSGSLPVVQELGRHMEGDIDMPVKDCTTVGCFGALSGSVPVLEYLHKRGCDFRKKNDYLNNSYHCCCMVGNVEALHWLHKNDPDADVNETGQNGQSPLHKAAFNGHSKIVSFLIKNGAFLESLDEDENTPFLLACQKGDIESLNILKEAGCSTAAKNEFSHTALHLASEKGHSKIVSMLIKNGAKLESADKSGYTPFLWACFGGDLETIDVLKKANCNTLAKDEYDQTALHKASEKGHSKIVSMLIKNGAKLESVDKGGSTPFLLACVGGDLETINVLKKANCNTIWLAKDKVRHCKLLTP